MMRADLRCATCGYWSRKLPGITTGMRRPKGADQTIGTCAFSPPVLIPTPGGVVSMQPETHEGRSCVRWISTRGGPGGPDGGHEEEVVALADRRAAA